VDDPQPAPQPDSDNPPDQASKLGQEYYYVEKPKEKE
jgi:hypothetical protein